MAATAFRKTENASWKKVREILAQLQEKYGLAYAGVPRTVADAQKIVKENAGFVILKNAGEAFYEPAVRSRFGAFDVNGEILDLNATLVYGLTEEFTYQHYVTFCKEFETLIGRTVKLASKKTDKWIKFKYTLIEKPFPETFEINPGPIDVLKEDEKAIKIQPQLNGQEEFQIF
jgi:hypothetical protein